MKFNKSGFGIITVIWILYLQTFPFWGSGLGTYARHLASEAGKKHKDAILAPDERPLDTFKG